MNSGKQYRLGEIVEKFGGRLIGSGEIMVSRVAPLDTAAAGDISFLSQERYRHQLETTRAAAVIVGPSAEHATGLPRIVCDNPYAFFARVSALLNPTPTESSGVHPTAVIAASAKVSPSASIGAFVCVGANVKIGDGTAIGSGCHIGAGTTVGENTRFYARVVVLDACEIGSRVILHSGAVIGADGFGLALENGRWLKIPQVGRVVIGNDVEIGANTTVDRGTMEDTVIEEGVKLDNQIQIAHNVRIGAHTAIAGCTGVAGSTRIGRHCTIAGAANIAGHLEIADHVNISGGTSVTKSIHKPGTYTGVLPISPHEEWRKNAAHFRHLERFADKIRALEKRINELEKKT